MAFKGTLITEIMEKGLVATARARIEKLGILPRVTRARPTRIKTY